MMASLAIVKNKENVASALKTLSLDCFAGKKCFMKPITPQDSEFKELSVDITFIIKDRSEVGLF